MSGHVLSWWIFLCAVSALNVLAWGLSAAAVARRADLLDRETVRTCWLQLLLSAGYVLGCAYRSVVPVFDVPRIVMHDSWLSSVIVGRSVATFAELCFAAQWALLLREVAGESRTGLARRVSTAIVPMIAVAEVFSWYSVLTTSNLGHVVEESLWGFAASLIVASLVSAWPRLRATVRPAVALCCVAGTAYVAYMFLVDVPMYWSRWLSDESAGRNYLDIADGALDAASRWKVSHRWDDWKSEVIWMSAYFSAAVWISIGMVHLARARATTRR
jgi:hypothetical protein